MAEGLQQAVQAQRDMWGKGDWGAIGARMEGASRQMVESAGVKAGDRVLDVAAGEGPASIHAAMQGAFVVATDLTPGLVEKGRARTIAEGLQIEWHEADMHQLPFEDGSFDVVISAFGVIYSPDRDRALAEMERVLRPGGTLALANWTREGFQGRAQLAIRKYTGEPKGNDPLDWGSEKHVSELLQRWEEIRSARHPLYHEFKSPEQWWEHAEVNAPPLVTAKGALPSDVFQAIKQDLISIVRDSSGGSSPARWQDEYLVTVAKRPS